MRLRLTAAALDEFLEASAWYRRINPQLGSDFVDTVEAAKSRLIDFPLLGPRVSRTPVRRLVLTRFPYQLVYRVEGDEIVIYAVAHQSRRPGYWRKQIVRE